MQDAQLISQAGLVESLASDGLVSVSTGAGQPQKNMELAKFADSLGSSVPLQQTSEQVNITGLYARTSDGKMVELTKESVASVVAGLIGSFKDFGNLTDADTAVGTGMYKIYGSVNNSPVSYGVLSVFNAGDYILQVASDVGKGIPTFYVRSRNSNSWTSWMALNNFGYNSLAELSSGVAEQMNPEVLRDGVDFNEETTTGHFFARNGHTNSPDNSAWWYVEVLRFVRGVQIYILQRVVRDNNASMYVRTRTDSGWTGWKQMALS